MFILLHIEGKNWRVNVNNISHYYERIDGKVVVCSTTGASWNVDESVEAIDKMLGTVTRVD